MTTTQQPRMSIQRRPPGLSRFAGLAFAVAFTAGMVILMMQPNVYDGSLDEYAASYADSGLVNRVGAVAYIIWPLAGALLVWTVAHIGTGIDRATGHPSTAVRVAAMSAVVTATGMTVGASAYLAGAHVSSGDSAGFAPQPAAGYALEVFAGSVSWASLWGIAAVMVAIAVAARRAGLVPGWVLWAGVVAAPLLPLAWIFALVPLLVFLLWLATVGFLVKTENAAAA